MTFVDASLKIKKITLIVDEINHGKRLDSYLQGALPGFSRTRLQGLLKEQLVKNQDSIITKANYKVKIGEVYNIEIPPPQDLELKPQNIALDIIFEDNDLIVINKPAGMVVHPAAGNWDQTLVNALLAHCGESLSGIGGVKRPGIIHRLDKNTSGLMVIAKNDFTHRAISNQFDRDNRLITRVYLALVWGKPFKIKDIITTNIGRHPRNRQKMAVLSQGKLAISEYELRCHWPALNVSLLQFCLHTGRTHQIRVHCQFMECPIIGDPLYGKKNLLKSSHKSSDFLKELQAFPRQALHAKSLKFQHPHHLNYMDFHTNLPNDMQSLINVLNS